MHRVLVSVAGLAPDGTATLSLASSGVTVVLTHDSRCDTPPAQSCQVAGSPTTFEFTAVAPPGTGASLAFTVTPDGNTPDADRSNNRATVPLGS